MLRPFLVVDAKSSPSPMRLGDVVFPIAPALYFTQLCDCAIFVRDCAMRYLYATVRCDICMRLCDAIATKLNLILGSDYYWASNPYICLTRDLQDEPHKPGNARHNFPHDSNNTLYTGLVVPVTSTEVEERWS